MPYRVGIITTHTPREVILGMAKRMHVWVLDNRDNRPVIQSLWGTGSAFDLERGATLFSSPPRLETHADWMSLIEAIEVHHGEYSHHPPVDEIEVVGAPASTPAVHALSEYGFRDITQSDHGFVARKPSPL
ncbi:MAG TPA: hypothetical protein VKY89_20705 [Thermoanaerobaculia bacterium]|nr:hypothetical protein [Thermoanaerobaculia bacterium]